MLRALGKSILAAAILGLAAFPATTGADDKAKAKSRMKAVAVKPESIEWVKDPPSLPAGAKIAVLDGDLAKAGPYTFRVKVPDGYRVPLHTHPVDEHVTVIQGTVILGMGDNAGEGATVELPTGAFCAVPKGMKHHIQAKGETIVQIHGTGPWGIIYVNPADDPRNVKK